MLKYTTVAYAIAEGIIIRVRKRGVTYDTYRVSAQFGLLAFGYARRFCLGSKELHFGLMSGFGANVIWANASCSQKRVFLFLAHLLHALKRRVDIA